MNPVDVLETIAAFDLSIGRYKQLDKYMKLYEYSRSRSFHDFGPRSFTYQNKNWFLSETK